MDAYSDPSIEDITFVACTQVGKTECINNCTGYSVHQDPGPTLFIYPTQALAETISVNRLQPMIESTPVLAEEWLKKASKVLEIQFKKMYLALVGSNSPSSLASRPIKNVLMDELEKFGMATKEEADPESLAIERTKTFAGQRKILAASTPTHELGRIWKRWQSAHARYRFHVPCPQCGHYQVLTFDQLKWSGGLEASEDEIRASCFYQCEACQGRIEDRHKARMLGQGKWIPENEVPQRIRKVAFHLNALYSPWVTFAEMAIKFVESRPFPDEFRNFVNSWLGEPWRDQATSRTLDQVLALQSDYGRGVVPVEAKILTAGADVQKGHIFWMVVAWGDMGTHWIIDYGRIDAPEDDPTPALDELAAQLNNRVFPTDDGREMMINMGCIDSGNWAQDVYQFCTTHGDVWKPIKGASRPLTTPYTVSTVEKGRKHGGLKFWLLDTVQYKDWLSQRMGLGTDKPGAAHIWTAGDDTELIELATHLTSEQKVDRYVRGKLIREWHQRGRTPNHLWDAYVYNGAAADILGYRRMKKAERPERTTTVQKEVTEARRERSGFLNRGRRWLGR
jgi:phage terminase large subunit GpA-like protein